jgi:hypothetical protein
MNPYGERRRKPTMFSTKDKAERTAAQAWDYLSAAMTTAGVSAKEAGKYTAEVASGQAAKLADVAGQQGYKLSGKANKKSAKLAAKASRTGAALAGTASDKADEAWARANAAAAALAGRKPGKPWGLIIGFGLLGVALGWAAASTARAALERQAENEELELAETAIVVTPTFDA